MAAEGRGQNAPNAAPSRPKGRGGVKGSGRGRGGNRSGSAMNDDRKGDNHQSNGRRGGRGANGPQKKVEQPPAKPEVEAKAILDTEDGEESEVCWVCADTIIHESVAPCNHRTCHVCSIRMRALYKEKNCVHCRQPAPAVIFTDNTTKRYEEFTDSDIASTDPNIGIRYESRDMEIDVELLLRYNCPDSDCDVACLGWPDLHRHVRTKHNKKICDLCSRHKKVFTHEHDLLTDAELSKHMKKGDDNPGAADQSGFKGHPLCAFCGQRFYGDDELFVHCREKHEKCAICERETGGHPQYFVDYSTLRVHFIKDHYMCSDPACLELKYIVFPNELELKAHMLSEHGKTLSKDALRDARTVDVSGFDYRAPYVQERSGRGGRGGGSQRGQGEGREARGRGRGRDPNAEAIPASSAQPLRRDEQAFQRQMAIHSAQSVTTRTFGGQLTSNPTPAQAHAPAAAPISQTANIDAATRTVNSLELSQPSLTPQEQARALRHRDVIDRANRLLQNDNIKMARFRDSISSYQRSTITATALIEAFFALFIDTSASALGSLIRDVADLFEDKSKQTGLRTAWNDWRAINEDYPSLPAASSNSSSSIPLNWAVASAPGSNSGSAVTTVKSSRVLRLKSSTAQSSRSKVSQARSWGSASMSTTPSPAVASSSYSANPFPVLPSATSRPQNTQSTKINTTPWIPSSASTSESNSMPGSAKPTPPTSRPASRNVAKTNELFPALPPAPKPQSSIFGYGTGMVRRDGGRGTASANPWTAGGSSAEEPAAEPEETGKGKKKGNKGKKVLVSWG